MSLIRRRLGFTNVAVVLALLFAMSGGAFAASKYLITSTKQISPKVLKQLTGKAGPSGAAGKEGPAGKEGKEGKAGTSVTSAESVGTIEGHCVGVGGSKLVSASGTTYACNGKEGKEGKEGKASTSLKANETERGVWATTISDTLYRNVAGDYIGWAPITFATPLPFGEAVEVRFVLPGKETTECKGGGTEAEAEAGYLCIYGTVWPESGGPTLEGSATEELPFGYTVGFISSKPEGYARGYWAVTAVE